MPVSTSEAGLLELPEVAAPAPKKDTKSVPASARQLYDLLSQGYKGAFKKKDLLQRLSQNGIGLDDPRMPRIAAGLASLGEQDKVEAEFFATHATADEMAFLEQLAGNRFAIRRFEEFSQQLGRLFESACQHQHGHVATHLPQLAAVNPSAAAMSFASVDGQRCMAGDSQTRVSLQSISRLALYALALEQHGAATVHRHIGMQPASDNWGREPFNQRMVPSNPLSDAGAVMCASMVSHGKPLAERFDALQSIIRGWAGEAPIFNNALYRSMKDQAHGLLALAHQMKDQQAYADPAISVEETVDLCLQVAALELSTPALAALAAALANGGTQTLTGAMPVSAASLRPLLAMMHVSGFGAESPEFSAQVGIPAMTSLSGIAVLVIPGRGGLALWSPRVNESGNSVMGCAFAYDLAKLYAIHWLDGVAGVSEGRPAIG